MRLEFEKAMPYPGGKAVLEEQVRWSVRRSFARGGVSIKNFFSKRQNRYLTTKIVLGVKFEA